MFLNDIKTKVLKGDKTMDTYLSENPSQLANTYFSLWAEVIKNDNIPESY